MQFARVRIDSLSGCMTNIFTLDKSDALSVFVHVVSTGSAKIASRDITGSVLR